MTWLAVAILEVFGAVAACTTFWRAQAFLVQGPAVDAAGAARSCASGASWWAGNTFATFLVGAVTSRAGTATST